MSASGGCGHGAIKRGSGLTPSVPGRVSQLDRTRGRLFAFVGLSDNRGLAVFVLLVVIFRLVIIIIVWLIGCRGGIVLPTRFNQVKRSSAMRWIMSASITRPTPLTRADPRRFGICVARN